MLIYYTIKDKQIIRDLGRQDPPVTDWWNVKNPFIQKVVLEHDQISTY
jgi:hypothetical protein